MTILAKFKDVLSNKGQGPLWIIKHAGCAKLSTKSIINTKQRDDSLS
jgi:hypothetical protein